MNYVTEMYLDYLEEAEEYQNIFEYFLIEATPLTPEKLQGYLTQHQSKLQDLIQHKANLVSGNANPQTIAAVDANIKAMSSTVQQLQAKAATFAPAGATVPGVVPMKSGGGPPETSPTGQAQAQIAATPPDPAQQLAKIQNPTGGRTGPRTDPGTGATAPTTTSPRADVAAPPVDVPIGQQIQQTASDAAAGVKQAGQDVAAKGKELGQDVMTKSGEIAGAPSQALPPGVAGPPAPGTGLAGGAETGLTGVGVDPGTAGGVGSAIQAVGTSPLGMAALGGAAAFGGYKLYKRFLSKGARACRGYSGDAKTSCMKSYMGAKKGQASMRGAETAAAT